MGDTTSKPLQCSIFLRGVVFLQPQNKNFFSFFSTRACRGSPRLRQCAYSVRFSCAGSSSCSRKIKIFFLFFQHAHVVGRRVYGSVRSALDPHPPRIDDSKTQITAPFQRPLVPRPCHNLGKSSPKKWLHTNAGIPGHVSTQNLAVGFYFSYFPKI